MARTPKRRQCPRCATWNEGKAKACVQCHTPLVRPRWRMDKQRLRYVHILARRKGLDDETYRLRLGAVGVESSKDLKRAQYVAFVDGLKGVPDVGGG